MAKCSFVWKILGVCLTVTLIAANNIQIQRNQDLNFTKNDRYLPKHERGRYTTLNKYGTWGHSELIEGGGIVYARGKVRIRNPFRKSDKTYSAPRFESSADGRWTYFDTNPNKILPSRRY